MHKSSGWANGWNGDGKYAPDRMAVPGCGGTIVAAECVDRIVDCWFEAIDCNGLNSLPSDGGNTVVGIDPGNVGETENSTAKKIRID